MPNWNLVTLLITLSTPVLANNEAFTIDAINSRGYYTYVEVTVNNSFIKRIDCRFYKNDRIVGSDYEFIYNTGWNTISFFHYSVGKPDRAECRSRTQ